MGDGRGPAHRSPAPAALLSAKALRVDRAWLRAARGAWYAPVQFYTSTTLSYREPLRDLLSVLEYQTTCYHGVRDALRRRLFKHPMNMITIHISSSALDSPSRDSAL